MSVPLFRTEYFNSMLGNPWIEVNYTLTFYVKISAVLLCKII